MLDIDEISWNSCELVFGVAHTYILMLVLDRDAMHAWVHGLHQPLIQNCDMKHHHVTKISYALSLHLSSVCKTSHEEGENGVQGYAVTLET